MKILLDCDPGHDDAVALLYAACHLDLVAMTTVYGNQTLDHVTRNALGLCRLAQLDIPVARGAAKPLLAPAMDGGTVHGKTGLDGAELPEPDRDVVEETAAELIIRLAREHRGELVVAATGSMTNLALALLMEPRLREWLKGISIMGGTTGIGNVTAVAEFNIYCDPEAADIVFRSGVPLWMVGLDVTRRVGVDAAGIASLRQGGRLAKTMADLLDFFLASLKRVHGLSTASLHDPCALVPFIDPSLMTYRHTHVAVDLASPLTRGMTVCDLRHLGQGVGGHFRLQQPPNVWLARDPAPGLVPHILDAIRRVDARLR
ncbi:nucleoside hydrolase [Roseomonas sp. OT10]|uniref:nucleoside hydrolase n=1 Tax=Roseomonas cutis TaxID=2897332 RepID=UPI001E642B64|nr:nucleoside hydrolase [Roseomonas sp. OT10]UFN48992.1 nucleoside hydrolase [Roseomonas sp. OT10]